MLQFWTEARLRIKAIDAKNHAVLFTGGSWRPLTWSGGYYVDNVFEGLRMPGSWYLDRGRASSSTIRSLARTWAGPRWWPRPRATGAAAGRCGCGPRRA